jgi:serine/threonine protein phosphatase 1
MAVFDSNSKLVLRLPKNEKGRDFVFGDLHGAHHLLDVALKQVNFDASCDRLFSVGDLIDRGVDSFRVGEFLRRQNTFAVFGNHELDFCCMSPDEVRLNAKKDRNGIGWARDLTDDQVLSIQKTLRLLPLVIEIETSFGKVGIVHAEVPIGMDWDEFLLKIESLDVRVIASATAGRTRLKRANCSFIEGVSRVFSGHTVQWDGAVLLGNSFFIDTGAIFAQVGLEAKKKPVEIDGFFTMVDICALGHSIDTGPIQKTHPTRVITVECGHE